MTVAILGRMVAVSIKHGLQEVMRMLQLIGCLYCVYDGFHVQSLEAGQ